MQAVTLDDKGESTGKTPELAQLAAAYVVRELAKNGRLSDVLETAPGPGGRCVSLASDPLVGPLLDDVVHETGLPRNMVDEMVCTDLDKIARFAGSGGKPLRENVRAAEYLIKSGRLGLVLG